MNLTDEEIRIKVAEAHGTMRWSYALPTKCIGANVPNYPEDLNACASFEATLTDAEHLRYRVQLWNVVITEGDETTWDRQFVSATARQRCLAYLKTKGLIP